MTVPTSDARALHDILQTVCSGSRSPQGAWAEVLDAEFETLEFARRHAEVVGLYTGTMAQIASLPDRSRERFERYAWKWWLGIVAPQHGWPTAVHMHTVVDHGALDQLGSAADLIESRMEGSLAVPSRTDLGDLRVVCQEWIDAVSAETDLPEPLRSNLLQDLHHILWLIEHADLFGVARAAAAGQEVIGSVITAGQALPPTKHGVWLERSKKLVSAVVLLGALHAGVNSGLMLAQNAGHFMEQLTSASNTADPSAPGPIGEDATTSS